MWVCSSKVEAVLLASSVSFLRPELLNPSRNSDRNKTSTCYKAIIQFSRLSKANEGKSNIDNYNNMCKSSNVIFQPSSQPYNEDMMLIRARTGT